MFVIFIDEHRGVLQYHGDHCVATVDFSKMSPVCGSRSAAAASAQTNSHSSQMSAVMERARENVSFSLEFPWKGEGLFCFVFFVVDCHKFAVALFNMFQQQPCLYFAIAPEIAVSRIQCIVLRMANEYL